jgi:DNA-binding SARP family transcriptional activator
MPAHTELRLLDTFGLFRADEPVSLPMSAQRVLAFLALHERPLPRAYLAGSLWAEHGEAEAHACLRSALWRVTRRGLRIVAAGSGLLSLDRAVTVDLRVGEALARRALREPDVDVARDALRADLLTGWYDDWVLLERERYRQLRLQALEAVCAQLVGAGRIAEALEAGLAVVAAEPLRETAHSAVMRAHIAQGNTCEAIRQYDLLRALLRRHLGLEPSARVRALLPARAA